MAKLSRNLTVGVLDPREALFIAGTLGSLNAEVVTASDGCNSVAIDLRGTFNMTVEIAGSVDGTNWLPIPVRPINVASVSYVAAIAGSTSGVWVGKCAQYRFVRARVTAYTSGAATTVLSAENGLLDDSLNGMVTAAVVTSVGASGAAVTLTLPSPGAGLRHYITYLSVNRFAVAALTAGAAPVTVTTTNLPGSLAFSFPADAALQGTMDRWREDLAYPLAASAQNAASTIVCPATTNVIWRATAGYYVAP